MTLRGYGRDEGRLFVKVSDRVGFVVYLALFMGASVATFLLSIGDRVFSIVCAIVLILVVSLVFERLIVWAKKGG